MFRKVVSIELSSASPREKLDPAKVLEKLSQDIHQAMRSRKNPFSAVVIDLNNIAINLHGNLRLEKLLHDMINSVLRSRNLEITRSIYSFNNSSLTYYVG